ncbi:unnamed protein product [Rhizophagus irregularis]|uniref:Uncharacterized protein n=1 Tax=Rhizophagus irregularis TaxID=588596 RepID=A0A2N1MCV3_9GLOM|nr:hypothetical protein RhiirC2_794841 [Rhizophagus irregularis]CAB4387843.1 unnamed protein product [Rhizophagus irregularis]
METNLSKAVPLYDYVNDIYKSTKYHNHAIQPQHHAGSDLILSLVDKSNKSKNVVLLSLSSVIYDKNVLTSKDDLNYNLEYDKTLKDYQVSRKPKFTELHHKITDVVDKRKCILVELPYRDLSKRLKRPDIFQYDKKGNLIVIVDNCNIKQVFGEKLANAIMVRKANSD